LTFPGQPCRKIGDMGAKEKSVSPLITPIFLSDLRPIFVSSLRGRAQVPYPV
jgi:hypothetical protein